MKKKVLYAAIKYPYANPELGFSYEYYNFLDSLTQIKEIEVKEFDWVGISKKVGKKRMNEKLSVTIDSFKPDLVFFSIFKDEFEKETLYKINKKAVTYNWFADDVSRFESYIKNWIDSFSWVSTATKNLIPNYKKVGFKNVIHARWATNPRVYKKLKLKKSINISFIGQAHSNRKRAIHELKSKSLDVKVWGRGWKNGVVSQKKMVRIFNQTKINLNLTSTHLSFPWGRFLPWFLQPKETRITAITGRICEIPACGSFLLTQDAPELDSYFKDDKEIAVFKSFDEMIEKARYYLEHSEQREKIAKAGYQRAQKEHTYEKRFTDIFKRIGLL